MNERETRDQPFARSERTPQQGDARRAQTAARAREAAIAYQREAGQPDARDAPGEPVHPQPSGEASGHPLRRMAQAARQGQASAQDAQTGTEDKGRNHAQNPERAGQASARDAPQAPPVFGRNDAPKDAKAPGVKQRRPQARAETKAVKPVFRRQEAPKSAGDDHRLYQPGQPKAPGRMLDRLADAASAAMRDQADEADENAAAQAVQAAHDAGRVGLHAAQKAQHAAKNRADSRLVRSERKPERADAGDRGGRHRQSKPRSGSNPLSRAKQRRDIRTSYAKQKRRAETAAKTAASAAQSAAQAVTRGVGLLPVLAAAFLLLVVMAGVSSCAPLVQAMSQAVVMTTYPASEEDILAAERRYAQKEAQLAEELANYALVRPGYDAYEVEADAIWHDPHVLIAMISAMRNGEPWTMDEAAPIIDRLFRLQYEIEEASYAQDGQRICRVTMKNRDLSHLPVLCMSEEQVGIYAVYKVGLGNMPELFAGNPYASALKDPVLHDIPQAPLDADPAFAALMEEAEKYIGYPYVWGGSNPTTSFDCSGFVCWVYSQSGVRETGRLGATGLYGACTEVSAEDVRPGDLVFFEGTMGSDVPGITHVGIYVGDNWMIHCGDPISFADLTRTYWQTHFRAYGRL